MIRSKRCYKFCLILRIYSCHYIAVNDSFSTHNAAGLAGSGKQFS